MNRLSFLFILFIIVVTASAQDFNELRDDGTFTSADDNRTTMNRDTTKTKKEIPIGLKVWTVDGRFGDRTPAVPDTLSEMFMNTIFTTGLRGEYNTTGNLGAPRLNRIFTDRAEPQQFIFTQPYDYFVIDPDKYHFTNTLSPITNLNYNTCGDRTNGEDHLKVRFAVNAGQRIGIGFKFDYIYARGYYANQSAAHFNYTFHTSYLGDRYQAHLLMSTNHQKVAENGGITEDDYITHPEIYSENYSTLEIPTTLQKNWNRNDNQHVFFSHRYSLGFNREVPMNDEEIEARKFAIAAEKAKEAKKEREKLRKEAKKKGISVADLQKRNSGKDFSGRPDNAKIVGMEAPADSTASDTTRIKIDGEEALAKMVEKEKKSEDTTWMKKEFVPVTSIIHTATLDNYRRIFQAYETPAYFYRNTYINNGILAGDSIYDKTKHLRLRNTVALAMLEGFNKWMKMGLKIFATHDMRRFEMPDTAETQFRTFNEHTVSIGGQLVKTQGSLLHYNITAETWVVGEDAGQLHIDGNADVNFKFLGDTVQLAARAYVHHNNPTFFYRKYHSKHLWWDNDDMKKELRTHIEGIFSYSKTDTRLRIAVDDIENYTYFTNSYTLDKMDQQRYNTVAVKQSSENIALFTAALEQNLKLGIINWQNVITYQKSSNKDILPVPDLNIYSNLFLKFRVAHVLDIDLGADVRYFTKYYGHSYFPLLGQFTVQDPENERVEIGNYPVVNVYANMNLKHTRFFIMMSHVNASAGNYFYTPHHPLNGSIIRFGLSWNFFN
ncbi:MAG: putative porin [Prevotella sp.]|nr:putative porin [Prevotella sp.]